jgi:hypothetical protein
MTEAQGLILFFVGVIGGWVGGWNMREIVWKLAQRSR